MKIDTPKKKKKKHRHLAHGGAAGEHGGDSNGATHFGDVKAKRHKLDNDLYEEELARLQVELVKMQEWIKHEGLRVGVVFEGRDAAGKAGVI